MVLPATLQWRRGSAGYPRIILIIPGRRAHHCTIIAVRCCVVFAGAAAACNALAFVRSTPARHVRANTMTWVYLCIYLRFLLSFPYNTIVVLCLVAAQCYTDTEVHQNPLQCLASIFFSFVARALKR